MKAVLILITVAIIILLIAVVITYFRFQKGDSELLNSKIKDIDTQKKCKSCSQMIELSAKVCQHCGRNQRSILNFLLFIPLVMAIIAGIQLFQAHQKTVDASKALNVATAAANDIKKIQTEINIAQDEINFSLLLTKASKKDRLAFFELDKIAKTKDHRFRDSANQAVEQISVDLQATLIVKEYLYCDKYNFEPENASLDDFSNFFDQVSLHEKMDIPVIIWSKGNFSKAEKLEWLYGIITTVQNLEIFESACKIMNKEAGLDITHLRDYGLYAKWWEENREEYNKNPEDQPTDSND